MKFEIKKNHTAIEPEFAEQILSKYNPSKDEELSHKYREDIYVLDNGFLLMGDAFCYLYMSRDSLEIFLEKEKNALNEFLFEAKYVQQSYSSFFYDNFEDVAKTYTSEISVDLDSPQILVGLDKAIINRSKEKLQNERKDIVAILAYRIFEKYPNSTWMIFTNLPDTAQGGCLIEIKELSITIDLHEIVDSVLKKTKPSFSKNKRLNSLLN
jgi:hypothetical protein